MSSKPTVAELEARLAVLESENAELSAQLGTEPVTDRRRLRGRAALAVVLIVLGSLLAPVAIVTSWSRVVLSDTDAVVATLAPLAKDARVQAYLSQQVTAAIEQQVDIDAMVNQVFDGLGGAIQGRPQAQLALQALRQPAADGVRSAIDTAVNRVVASDAFAQAWSEALRTSHAQTISALQGDPDAALTINSEGLGLRLAPLITRVKDVLAERGFALAAQIPVVDKTIVLAPAESLAQVQLAYRSAVMAGFWLALVVLALVVGGIVAAVNRARATVWAAVGLGLAALAVLTGLAAGRIAAQIAVPAAVMPNDLLQLFYDTVSAALTELATATLVLAVVVGVAAWLAGPFASARRLRAGYASLVAGLRESADARQLSSGRLGEWLYANRVAVRALIGAGVGATLLLNRPITAGLVIGVAVTALVLLLMHSLLERPALVSVAAPLTSLADDAPPEDPNR